MIFTDPLPVFWHIIISSIITITIVYIAKLCPVSKHSFTVAMIFAGSYILISQLLLPKSIFAKSILKNTSDVQLATLPPGKRATIAGPLFSGINVEPGTFPDSVIKIHDAEIPVMGPLDGLSPEDMNSRLNYMYRKTAYPYKPMTYFDFVTDSDKLLEAAGAYQVLTGAGPRRNLEEYRQEMERWYPSMTKDQINVRDCTNYPPGSPASCLIKPASLLLDNKGKALVESFESYTSMPKSLDTLKTLPTLFKNAPNYVNVDNMEAITDISHNISRGGVIGKCRSDYCGSRVLEPGNDNIVDVDNMFRAYLQD